MFITKSILLDRLYGFLCNHEFKDNITMISEKMFRELVRKKQQLSTEETIEILKKQVRGVLSVLGEDGYPYGMPINYWYNEVDGKIYFHTGKSGYRTDALKKHNKVSFCVYDEGFRRDGEWALNIKSVIVFGKINMIEDEETIKCIMEPFSKKFTQDDEYIQNEIETFTKNTLLLELTIDNLCGKLVNES